MKTSEEIANFCEAQLANKLSFFNDSRIIRMTPSVQGGRRFIGFEINNGEDCFLITIEVEKAEDAI